MAMTLHAAMVKGPLVTAAAVLATILIVLSFAVVAFPDSMEIIAVAAGVVAAAAVAVMVLMFFRMRGST